MFQEPFGQRSFGKRRPAGEQEVEGAAQRVDVGPMIQVGAVEGLLGGHVVGGARGPFVFLGRFLPAAADQSGHAQVEDLYHALPVDQQVGRLDVAMDHVVAVGVGQAAGRLAKVIDGPFELQGAFGFHHPLEVLPLDELHHHVVAVVFPVDVVGMDDIRMVQRRDRPGLAKELLQRGGILAELLGDDLQRHRAVHRGVLGHEDPAHAAAADQGG